jgi:hypothetical protein
MQVLFPWVNPSRFIHVRDVYYGVVRADVAYIPVYDRAYQGDMPPLTGVAWAAPRLHDHYAKLATALAFGDAAALRRNVVLYMARTPGRVRSVTNEAALLQRLRERLRDDLQLVVLTDPAPTEFERVAMLSTRAVVMMGPHGGAFMVCGVPLNSLPALSRQRLTLAVLWCAAAQNAMFMRPDRTSHIVEIMSLDVPQELLRPCFAFLANANNITYWQANTTAVHDFYSPITADVADVMQVLASIGVLK